jgi:polar amino acid transport system substrate-binding protein
MTAMWKAFFNGAVGIALGTVLVAAAPASARTLDEIISSGTIRVGVNATLPPLGKYNEQNQIVGFDVDYANEIAGKLGIKLEVVSVGSPDRIPFVSSGRVDFVMGAMTRNAERAKVIDFTLPVYTEGFGVLATGGRSFKDWSELNSPDVKLVQVRGTTPVAFIQENMPKAEVTLLDNYPDAIRALAQGRGNAMVDVIDYVGDYMKDYNNAKWQVTAMPVQVDYDCLGVAKNSSGLKDWLNVAVFEVERSGKRAELWKKWFGIEMTYPIPVTPYF